MSIKTKNILYSLLAVLMLVGFALAIPSGTLTQEARQSHLDDVVMMDDAGDEEMIILFDE